MRITPEQAQAELERRAAARASTSQITPEEARAELARRNNAGLRLATDTNELMQNPLGYVVSRGARVFDNFMRQPVADANPAQAFAEEAPGAQMFVQGATFGFGDELTGAAAGAGSAAGGGSYSEGYRENTDAAREGIAFNREHAPVTSFVTEMLGGSAVAFPGAKGFVTGATNRIGLAGRSAGVGAAAGGVAGFGEDQGGVMDRLDGAALGAAGGAVIGGGSPLLLEGATRMTAGAQRVVGRAWRNMRNGTELTRAQRRAWDQALRIADEVGVSEDELMRRLRQLDEAGLSEEQTIAELFGEAGVHRARGGVATGDSAALTGRQHMNTRQSQQPERVRGYLNEGLGSDGSDFADTRTQLNQPTPRENELYGDFRSNEGLQRARQSDPVDVMELADDIAVSTQVQPDDAFDIAEHVTDVLDRGGDPAAFAGRLAEPGVWRAYRHALRRFGVEYDLSQIDRLPLSGALSTPRDLQGASPEAFSVWFSEHAIGLRGVRAIENARNYHWQINAPDGNMAFNLRALGRGAGHEVSFNLDGMFARAGESAPDLGRASRTLTNALASLQGFVIQYQPRAPLVFSGATPAHTRAYQAMARRFSLPGYQMVRRGNSYIIFRNEVSDASTPLVRRSGSQFGPNPDDALLNRGPEIEPAPEARGGSAWTERGGSTGRPGSLVRGNPTSRNLDRFLENPRFRRIASQAAQDIFDETGERVSLEDEFSPALIDAIKRRMDRMIDDASGGAAPNTAASRPLRQLRDRWVQFADEAYPNYAPARAEAQVRLSAREALEEGRQIFRTSNVRNPEELARLVEGMTEKQRQAFRVGVARGVVDQMNAAPRNAIEVGGEVVTTSRDASNPISRFWNRADRQEALRAAFGDEAAFRRFVQRMAIEGERADTFRLVSTRTQGSPTQGNQAAAAAASGLDVASDAAEAVGGNPIGVALRRANQLLRGQQGNWSPEVESELQKILWSTVPEQRARLLRVLQSRNLISADQARAISAARNASVPVTNAIIQGGGD